MRTRSAMRVVALYAVTAIGLAAIARGAEATPATTPVPLPAAELAWTDLDPTGAPGVKFATLWGNLQTGAFGAFLRLPAGFDAPLHSHTHAIGIVIVSGTYIQGPEGKPAFRLGPGSYLMQPGGDYRHTTRCDPASECLLFFESEGGFDLFLAATPDQPKPSRS